jgi:hypothetical protein
MRYTQNIILAIGLACLSPADAFATRGKLLADCIIQIKGAAGGQTRVTVMPGTSPAFVLTPTTPRFVLELVLEETYLLTFEHPGCVTKQLYVDTTVPIEMRTSDFDFPMKVVLEHHKDPFIYAGPVGFIFYEHAITDFSYNTDYAVRINERFAERMAELTRTGVDPRSAIGGYTASTTPPAPAPVLVKDTVFMPFESTVAPTVAHVPPMVHRLIRPDTLARIPEVPLAPVLAMEPRAPATPLIMPGLPEPTSHPAGLSRIADAVAREHTEPIADTTLVLALERPRQAYTRELIVEERRITTVIRFADQDDRSTEYRRVLHSSGAAYYFHDGRSITQHSYDQATHHARNAAIRADGEHRSLQQ